MAQSNSAVLGGAVLRPSKKDTVKPHHVQLYPAWPHLNWALTSTVKVMCNEQAFDSSVNNSWRLYPACEEFQSERQILADGTQSQTASLAPPPQLNRQNDVLPCRQIASSSNAAVDSDQGTAESQAETTAEMQADKATKEATIASLLVGLAGLPGPEPSEEPPQLPHCLANVGGMQVWPCFDSTMRPLLRCSSLQTMIICSH